MIFILPAPLCIVVGIRDEIGCVVQGTMCRVLAGVLVVSFFTRQEKKSCGFKCHTIILSVVYSTSYHRLASQRVVDVMDGSDIARRGHVLRLGGYFLETSSI